MKVLFMGTPDFASCVLEKIINVGHEVIAVVTQPDKQKGRGQEVSFSPVKELSIKNNIPVYQPKKVREEEFLETIRELAPEVIVVAAFGQLLPKDLLDIPPYGCINVHASLLPKYRGAAPIQYSILDGEKETGITIMYMDVKLDAGDIILQSKLTIAEEETGGSLFDKLAVLGGDLLIEALVQIENKTAVRVPQDETQATFVKMLSKEMGRIDFTKSADEIERQIRGLNPWPSAYTYWQGKSLKLWKAYVENTDTKLEPGTIIEVRKDSVAVMTGNGALVIQELQLEGKKRMSCSEFLRGYHLASGMKFGE